MNIVIGIILILMSLFLIVAVLMQHGKSHGLSGTIAGGAETFFGKNKASSLDGVLSKVTTIVSIAFVVLVVVAYVVQGNISESNNNTSADTTVAAETTVADETTAADETTVADAETTAAEAETTVAE